MRRTAVSPLWRQSTAVAALIVSLLLCFWAGQLHQNTAANVAMAGKLDALCRKTLSRFGWEASELVCQEDFTLPDPFGPTYDTFLALQQEAGFDLTPYAGKTVLRYTYRIANYPAGSDTIYADLLLWQEQVIGGDLRSASLDGFLTSLNGSEKS